VAFFKQASASQGGGGTHEPVVTVTAIISWPHMLLLLLLPLPVAGLYQLVCKQLSKTRGEQCGLQVE
jgi:hypothetical protein